MTRPPARPPPDCTVSTVRSDCALPPPFRSRWDRPARIVSRGRLSRENGQFQCKWAMVQKQANQHLLLQPWILANLERIGSILISGNLLDISSHLSWATIPSPDGLFRRRPSGPASALQPEGLGKHWFYSSELDGVRRPLSRRARAREPPGPKGHRAARTRSGSADTGGNTGTGHEPAGRPGRWAAGQSLLSGAHRGLVVT